MTVAHQPQGLVDGGDGSTTNTKEMSMAKRCEVTDCTKVTAVTETYQTENRKRRDKVCRAHSGRFTHRWPMIRQRRRRARWPHTRNYQRMEY